MWARAISGWSSRLAMRPFSALRHLPPRWKDRAGAALWKIGWLTVPPQVRDLPLTQNRLGAAIAWRKSLDRWPRGLRRAMAEVAPLFGGRDRVIMREALVGADVQMLCRRGRHEEAFKAIDAEPDAVRLSFLLRPMRRALEMKTTRPSVSPVVDQLLGADIDYFAGKFCPKPFGDFEVGSNGDVHVCCPNYLPQPIGKADNSEETAQTIVNSDIARRIRRSILDGSFTYCNWMLCNDIQSDRLPDRAAITDTKMLDYIDAGDGRIEGPRDIRLSHDPTCNLWCPSCRSERITAKGAQFTRIMDMTERVIVPALRNAETVMMNGYGDIFSSRSCRRLLETINERDHPNLKLNFITNGVLFSEEEWRKFPNIHGKVASIRVSIDAATQATYDQVRLGGDWRKLGENLLFLSELRKRGGIDRLMISFVVQRANYREMADFYRWALSLGCDNIVFEHLMDWGSWNEATFRRNAVHLPDNPEYPDYVVAARALAQAAPDRAGLSMDLPFP